MTSRLFVGVNAAALGAAILIPGVAQAAPEMDIIWDAASNGGPVSFSWYNLPAGAMLDYYGSGGWYVDGNESLWSGQRFAGHWDVPGIFDLQWNIIYSDTQSGVAGPGGSAFVTANIVVTNNDIVTQNFSMTMTENLANAIPNTGEKGSISGTVTDLTFNGASVLAPAGSRIYTPRIDGADENPGFLMNDPFSQSVGPLGTAPVGPEDFGLINLIPATQQADASIAIFLSFDLTAGDSASFTAIFEVASIPGVGGLPILAAFGLLGRRRRRR